MDAPHIRIVVKSDADGAGVMVYLNEAGRDALVKRLSLLTPADRHFHLEPYLVSEPDGVGWADVVLHEHAAE